MPKHDNITTEYLKYHEIYTKKYGEEKTLVLMQVGPFYEAYATETKGPKISEIANLLNIVCTRRDKTIPTIDESNPYMMGFNLISAQKFIGLLINNGFTLIMVDQVTPPPKPKREVTNILSPSTYIENIASQDTNYCVCIYFEEELQKSSNNLLCAGMAALDLSTGKCYIHEAQSNNTDQKLALDESIRFINSLNPSETLIYYQPKKNGMTTDKLISYLELTARQYIVKNTIDKVYMKPSYQNEFLGKIYKNSGILTPIEHLDLDRLDYARTSLILLLEFAYEHNMNIINDISKPEQYMDSNNLILANNAIYQLNIIESNMYNEHINTKYKSLFDVVNNTSTAPGRRFLKDRLISPLVSHIELEKIYNNVDELIDKNLYTEIETHLRGVSDIERLERKLSLNILHPYELSILIESCEEIIEIYNILNNNNKLQNVIIKNEIIDKIKNFLELTEKRFQINELKMYNLNNINNSFFKNGIHTDLDKLKQDLQLGDDFMKELSKILSDYIDETGKRVTNKDKIQVKKFNGSPYLSLSKARAGALKDNLANVRMLKIGNTIIKTSDLIYENKKHATKIMLRTNTDDNEDDDIAGLTRKYYIEELKKLYADYHASFKEIIKFIAYTDYIKSNAKTAKLYNYKRPIIKYDPDNSFIECKQLRHPIIERIIDYEYVPHDVSIGKDLKGMLLFSPNSAGKSSLLKSIGLSIVLAQAGLYVSALQFIYSPYLSLYTRVNSSDNMLKGLSSFVVEILELKAILKRSNSTSLILCDELCRSTENISGNSIVATTVIQLSQLKASFIFASHFHDITKMKKIKKLENVKIFHISVEYDNNTDSLIYDRILKQGSGEPVYGLECAKYIIKDNKFIELANKIKNKLLKIYNELVPNKTSRYNNGVYVNECQMCGKQDLAGLHISQLESHHINFRSKCKDNFSIEKPHIQENSKPNLIILCNKCHDQLHNGEFHIEGYIMTSEGRSTIVKDKNGKKLLVNKNNKLLNRE